MNKYFDERAIRRAVVKWLFRNGWGTNLHEKETREHGVDIRVRNNKYPVYYLIEVKGGPSKKVKAPRSRQEVSFVYALGQLMTRINITTAHYRYGLGFPVEIAQIARRRIPWQLAKRLSLYVLSVDENEGVAEYSWRDLKKIQSQYEK